VTPSAPTELPIRLRPWQRLGVRIGALFVAVTLLAVGLAGIVIYERQKRDLEETLGTLLLNIARTGALLVAACLALVAVYALLGALGVTSNYATISVGQRLVNDFRSELYAHLQRLSLAFHSRRQVGDLLYRLTSDTFAIQSRVK